MKKSAAEIMKEIKAIKEQIAKIQAKEKEYAYKVVAENGTTLFSREYDFKAFRNQIEALRKREIELKVAIDTFNNKTQIEGLNISMIAGLARLAQLKNEIDHLEWFLKKGSVDQNYNTPIKVLNIDSDIITEEIKKLSEERSSLLIAIDKTNLNSAIEV